MIIIATRQLVDLYDDKTLSIIGGSTEFFFFSLYATDSQGNPTEVLDLSNIMDIEWDFAPYSVIEEKKTALLSKRYSTGEIIIIKDGSDGQANQIQVILESWETQNLQGAFLHQLSILDGSSRNFVCFESIININKRIHT